MAKDGFKDIVNSAQPTLVDFYADWCGPCKQMKPILEQVKTRMGGKVRILKIDVDKNQSLAAKLKIQSIPTLVLYKSGKILWRKAGVVPSHELEKLIKANI
jgi:thioredoxin 1